jgi:hypothetical protein
MKRGGAPSVPRWRDLAIGVGLIGLVAAVVAIRLLVDQPIAAAPGESAAPSADISSFVEIGSPSALESSSAGLSQQPTSSVAAEATLSATLAPTAHPTSRPTAHPTPAATPVPTPAQTPVPTPEPWGITGSMAPIDNTGYATWTGSVWGNPPPGIAPIDLACYLFISYPPGGLYGESYNGFTNTFTRDFQIVAQPGGYAAGGTGSWKVNCYPTVVYQEISTTGNVEFLPYQ